jgi:hypothetical protein
VFSCGHRDYQLCLPSSHVVGCDAAIVLYVLHLFYPMCQDPTQNERIYRSASRTGAKDQHGITDQLDS